KATETKGLAAIPVALTVLATIFAGMSSSEMTRSMYFRSLAAQHQAKTGSQWGFFQAKKMRGTTLETAGDLGLMFNVKPFDKGIALGLLDSLRSSEAQLSATNIAALPAAAKNLRDQLEGDDLKSALQYLGDSELPPVQAKPTESEPLTAMLTAIRSRTPESKTVELAAKLSSEPVEAAIEAAEANADAFDRACEPVTKAIRRLERSVGEVDRLVSGIPEPSNELKALAGAVRGAAMSLRFAAQDFTARRYDREAKFNQQIGELYEVQVRLAGHESERH